MFTPYNNTENEQGIGPDHLLATPNRLIIIIIIIIIILSKSIFPNVLRTLIPILQTQHNFVASVVCE